MIAYLWADDGAYVQQTMLTYGQFVDAHAIRESLARYADDDDYARFEDEWDQRHGDYGGETGHHGRYEFFAWPLAERYDHASLARDRTVSALALPAESPRYAHNEYTVNQTATTLGDWFTSRFTLQREGAISLSGTPEPYGTIAGIRPRNRKVFMSSPFYAWVKASFPRVVDQFGYPEPTPDAIHASFVYHTRDYLALPPPVNNDKTMNRGTDWEQPRSVVPFATANKQVVDELLAADCGFRNPEWIHELLTTIVTTESSVSALYDTYSPRLLQFVTDNIGMDKSPGLPYTQMGYANNAKILVDQGATRALMCDVLLRLRAMCWFNETYPRVGTGDGARPIHTHSQIEKMRVNLMALAPEMREYVRAHSTSPDAAFTFIDQHIATAVAPPSHSFACDTWGFLCGALAIPDLWDEHGTKYHWAIHARLAWLECPKPLGSYDISERDYVFDPMTLFNWGVGGIWHYMDKNEPHSKQKLEQGRIRLIAVADVVSQIVTKLISGASSKRRIEKYMDIPMKPGMGAAQPEQIAMTYRALRHLHQMAESTAGVLYAPDIKQWDWSNQGYMVMAVAEQEAMCCDPDQRDVFWIFRRVDAINAVSSLVVVNDMVYPLVGRWKSGHANTSKDNSAMATLMQRLAGCRHSINNGDDGVVVIPRDRTFHYDQVMSNNGLKIKESTWTPLVNIVPFCGFNYDLTDDTNRALFINSVKQLVAAMRTADEEALREFLAMPHDARADTGEQILQIIAAIKAANPDL